MPARPNQPIAIFCQVVDNFGDIGVCWRLARQWVAEFGQSVTLWVDDLVSFQAICKAVDPALHCQTIDGVVVRAWADAALLDAGVVIEAFGCALPPQIELQMLARKQAGQAPVWINLEYLSAESWVETCHGGASPQVSGLTRYFYFPGFSHKTGGLLAEGDLLARRDAFWAAPALRAQWQSSMGLADDTPDGAAGAALWVSLFCYPHAPLAPLLAQWQAGPQRVLCLVPEGVATQALTAWWAAGAEQAGATPAQDALPAGVGNEPQRLASVRVGAVGTAPSGSAPTVCLHSGMRQTRGALTVQIIPFVDQTRYDTLLWACDLNFVRGEDSFVRAQWAGRPFVWHIYPQSDDTHLEKLDAFLRHYTRNLPEPMQQTARDMALAWNQADQAAWQHAWPLWLQQSRAWREHAQDWAAFLRQNGNLADNLLQFIQKID